MADRSDVAKTASAGPLGYEPKAVASLLLATTVSANSKPDSVTSAISGQLFYSDRPSVMLSPPQIYCTQNSE
jgi:hypothetical protein